MLRASWKSLLARKVRLAMSALAIVLGVAFVSGSLIFTDTLGSVFDGIVKGSVADVNVGPKGAFDQSSTEVFGRPVTADVIRTVRAVSGVESAYGTVNSVGVYLFDASGKVMAVEGPPALGLNWFEAPAAGHQRGLVLTSGRPPANSDEVVIDPRSLRKSGHRLGDRIKIALPGDQPTIESTIVGTADYGNGGSAGASYTFFDTATAQRLFFDGHDVYAQVWVTVDRDHVVSDVRDDIQQRLPQGLEAVTGEDAAKATQSLIGEALSFMSTFLLVFAAISLVVGSFLIVNTFAIIVAQRGRELALLRALGANREQIRGSVLFEAVVVGVLGSSAGLVLGNALALGIKVAFARFGLDLGEAPLVLRTRTVLVSYLVGVGVTMVAAYLPARAASSVPPVMAMGGDMMTGVSGNRVRVIGGATMGVVGTAALLAGLFTKVPQPLAFVGVGALLMLLGVAWAATTIGRPVLWSVGVAYRRLWGEPGKLAQLNAARNPRRTAATASALMIGLALVTAMAILGASATVSIDRSVKGALRADFIVSTVSGKGMPTTIGDKMATVPGVQRIHRMRETEGSVNKQHEYRLVAVSPGAFDNIVAQHLEAGSLNDFTDNTVVMTAKRAAELNAGVGDYLDVAINGESRSMRLVATFSYPRHNATIGRTLITLPTLESMGTPPSDSRLAVVLTPGADAAGVRSALANYIADQPLVTVTDQAEYAQQQTGQVGQMLGLIYALLGLAIVIAILGIINTLGLSVVERTREIGLLRAIGLLRGQLRLMITLESVAIAVLGSVLGIALGLVFGYAIQRSLATQGLEILAIPWPQLAGFLAVAVVVGVLAAVYPAARAARMDILQAVTTE